MLTGRHVLQCVSLLVYAYAIICCVRTIYVLRRSGRGYMMAPLHWFVHGLVFYIFVGIYNTTSWSLPGMVGLGFGDWSAALRLHGIVAALTVLRGMGCRINRRVSTNELDRAT